MTASAINLKFRSPDSLPIFIDSWATVSGLALCGIGVFMGRICSRFIFARQQLMCVNDFAASSWLIGFRSQLSDSNTAFRHPRPAELHRAIFPSHCEGHLTVVNNTQTHCEIPRSTDRGMEGFRKGVLSRHPDSRKTGTTRAGNG
jgi:hypothetical protein